MTSRWTTNVKEDAERTAEQQRRKDEKRKRKHERRETDGSRQPQVERSEKRRRSDSTGIQDIGIDETVATQSFTTSVSETSGSIDRYTIINDISEGQYGSVSRAQAKETGKMVALKKVKRESTRSSSFPLTALREIQLLRDCNHNHILHLHEVVTDQSLQDVYLVLDFVEHDILTLLRSYDSPPFSLAETKTLIYQLCSAVAYLHENWIMHRDLKPSNLLLNNYGELKLADFGMARYTASPPPQLTQLVVTLWYRAPELLLGAHTYNFEIDVWSVGCVLAEISTGTPLFHSKNEIDHISKMIDILGNPTTKTWPQFTTYPAGRSLATALTSFAPKKSRLKTLFPHLSKQGIYLLEDILRYNPEERLTAREILQHPWFSEDPRMVRRELMPTFPSRAMGESVRHYTPPAPAVGGLAPGLDIEDLQRAMGEQQGLS